MIDVNDIDDNGVDEAMGILRQTRRLGVKHVDIKEFSHSSKFMVAYLKHNGYPLVIGNNVDNLIDRIEETLSTWLAVREIRQELSTVLSEGAL